MQQFKQMEIELNHSINLLSLAVEVIEKALEESNVADLHKSLSAIEVSKDILDKQLADIVAENCKS